MQPRARLSAGVVIALFSALYLFVALTDNWSQWQVDFGSYWVAATLYAEGQFAAVYAPEVEMIVDEVSTPEWLAVLEASGHLQDRVYPFIYPPWVAAVLAPLTQLVTVETAMRAMVVLSAAMMLGSIFLARAAMRLEAIPQGIWAAVMVTFLLTNITTTFALSLGQIQILIAFLCLLAMERSVSGHSLQSGVALGIAACIKITPAAFALIFVIERDWKALSAFGGTILAVGGLSLVAIGPELHQDFLTRAAEVDQHVVASVGGLSLESALFQLSLLLNSDFVFVRSQVIFDKPEIIGLVTKTLFVLVAMVLIAFRGRPTAERSALAWFALSISVPLFGPLAWSHYFLMTTFLLPCLIPAVGLRGTVAAMVAYSVLLAAVPHLMLVPEAWPVLPQPIVCSVFLFGLLLLALRGYASGSHLQRIGDIADA